MRNGPGKKKRKFNPWPIEKSNTQEIGNKPTTIYKISNNEFESVIKISNEKENKTLPSLTSLGSPQF